MLERHFYTQSQEEIVQRGCRRPIPGDIQSQYGWNHGHPRSISKVEGMSRIVNSTTDLISPIVTMALKDTYDWLLRIIIGLDDEVRTF